MEQPHNLTWVGYPNVQIRYDYIDTNEPHEQLSSIQKLRYHCMEMALNYSVDNPELKVDIYKEAKKMYLFILDNKNPK